MSSFSASALEQRNVKDSTQIGAITPSVSISSSPARARSAPWSPSEVNARAILPLVRHLRSAFTSMMYIDRPPPVSRLLAWRTRRTVASKGPQGTLYGRNTTGGAIKVTTTLPDYDKMAARVKIGGGNFGDVTGFAGISVPLVEDKVAVRVTAFWERNNGYGRDEDSHTNLGDLRTVPLSRARCAPG